MEYSMLQRTVAARNHGSRSWDRTLPATLRSLSMALVLLAMGVLSLPVSAEGPLTRALQNHKAGKRPAYANSFLDEQDLWILLGEQLDVAYLKKHLGPEDLEALKQTLFCKSLGRGQQHLSYLRSRIKRMPENGYLAEDILRSMLLYHRSDHKLSALFWSVFQTTGYAMVGPLDDHDVQEVGMKPWTLEEMLDFESTVAALPAAFHHRDIFLMVRIDSFEGRSPFHGEALAVTFFAPLQAIFFADKTFEPTDEVHNSLPWIIIHELAHVLDFEAGTRLRKIGLVDQRVAPFYSVHGFSHGQLWQQVSGWTWRPERNKDDRDITWVSRPTSPLVGIWRMPAGNLVQVPMGYNRDPYVTGYGSTSPHEDFAECVAAYFLAPRSLPVEKKLYLDRLLSILTPLDALPPRRR